MAISHQPRRSCGESPPSARRPQPSAEWLRAARTPSARPLRERPLSAERLRRAAPELPAGLRSTARAAAARIGPPLRGGTVYTDDKTPVEWLIDKSIVDYAAGD